MQTYIYDSNGNITRIYVGDVLKYAYHYDKLGQLVRVDDYVAGCTYTYQYDYAGNITYKHKHYLASPDSGIGSPIETSYYDYSTSEWGDLLTGYNSGTITYDTIGNPLSYYNGTGYTFTWEQGRRLATAVKESYNLSFTYNDEGIRTSKTVNNVKHTYYLAGSRILAEEWGNNLLIYLYDADGSPIGMRYRNSSYASGAFDTYWFEKNLQGDIVAVYNENGTLLVSYVYDAWGNVATPTYYNNGDSTAVQYNPFRYRGYYYDSELGFYYLNSRYYDPETCRFVNADSMLSTGQGILGYNMFAYCRNEPVFRKDAHGTDDVCVDIFDEDNNPLNDLLGYSPSGSGSGGAYGYFDSYAYQTYSIKSATDVYNSSLGGYYAPSLSSGVTNPGYYNVLGAVSVTDNMASNNYMKPTAHIPNKKSVVNHIFINKSGHILHDTPDARFLLESTTANKYYYGSDMYGNAWYQRIQTNGSQIWVQVRSNVITDGGINNVPKSWDPMTGFKQNLGGRR